MYLNGSIGNFDDHEGKTVTGAKRHLHELQEDIPHETAVVGVVGADNPYSLVAIYFGHLAIKADSAVYVTRRVPVEVMSRSQKNCTEEIPVVYNRTKIFVDPIS